MKVFVFYLTTLVLRLWTSIPPTVVHNLEKSQKIHLLMWQQNVEKVEGDYVEFGVASGNSLMSATLSSKRAKSRVLGVSALNRHMHGFDTFEKFISSSPHDDHKTWIGGSFSFPLEKVRRRFRRFPNVFLHKVNAEDLKNLDSYGILNKVSIALFDMDLYAPTKAALVAISPKLQNGSFLIFDEYFAFKGDETKGESRAVKEFLIENPLVHLRFVSTYGAGGAVFLVNLDHS